MTNPPLADRCVAVLIDANLDRAREGLRVVEDWCRFGLKRQDLVVKIKNWRQQLGVKHHLAYKKSRSIKNDSGLGLSHPAQFNRKNPSQITSANFARAQEALRVIEEYARYSDPDLSAIAAQSDTSSMSLR